MEESGLTRTRESLGTPDYMAPEQAREAALVGPPADVYALGIIIFQLLTGQTPYQGATTIDIIEKHKYSPIPSPRTYAPSLPASFDEFFQRVLAKDPAVRTQTVEEMMSLLATASAGETLPPDPRYQAPPPPPTPQPVGTWAAPATPPPQTYYPPQQRQGTQWWVWLVGLLAIVAIGAVIYFFVIDGQSSKLDRIYADGLDCFQSENWACCTNEFQKVVDIDPTYRDAAERLDECQHRWDLDTTWKELNRCLLIDDWACIRETSQTIITELDPTDPAARKASVDASFELATQMAEEDPEQALQILQEAEESGGATLPDGFDGLAATLESYLAGIEAFGKKEYPDAIDLLTPIRSFGDSEERIYTSYVRLCNAALEEGELAAAGEYAREARAIKPGGAEAQACAAGIEEDQYAAQLATGLAHLDAEEWEQALETCAAALDIDPGGGDAKNCIEQANQALYEEQIELGQANLAKCQLDDAIAAFDNALYFKPNDATAKAGIAEATELEKSDTKQIADSWNGWSSAQGRNGWYYLAGPARQQISWGGDGYWWNRGEGSRIQQKNQHPGRGIEVVRRWKSGINGTVKVKLDFRLENWRGNTQLTILKNGQRIWSGTARSTSNQTITTPPFSVAPENNIDLVVGPNGSQTNDNTFVHVTIFSQVPRCKPQ